MRFSTPHLSRPIAWGPAITIMLGLLALHLACIGNYGYFRDELYYLACARRLDWGYVDQPPLSIALLRLTTDVFGDAIWAIRLPTILSGVVTALVLMGTTARLGGDGKAQALAGLTFAAAPVYRVVNHVYSMNGLDVMFWSVAIWWFVRVLQEDRTTDWVGLGVTMGLALMNKLSALWLLAALGIGLLFSDRRTALLTIRPYLALLLAGGVAMPHLIWQVAYGWPTREFVENANTKKLLPMTPWHFLGLQAVVMNPLTLPVWGGGLVVALRSPRWRALGVGFLTVMLILMINGRSRENYLSPAYPFVIAPGAIWLVDWCARNWRWKWKWAPRPIPTYFSAVGLSGAATASIVLPLLPIHTLAEIYGVLPTPPPSTERGAKSPVQGFGDMVGWPEQAAMVARAYHELPPERRRHAAILTYNYGEAAAVERFGRDIPAPISTHNNYWIWGPRDWDGKTAIVIGQFPPEQLAMFRVRRAWGKMAIPMAMPEEGRATIWVAEDLKVPVSVFWDATKRLE